MMQQNETESRFRVKNYTGVLNDQIFLDFNQSLVQHNSKLDSEFNPFSLIHPR